MTMTAKERLALLEPGAFDAPLIRPWAEGPAQVNEETRTLALMSMAISLKRIADALELQATLQPFSDDDGIPF